jgi:hypothetical protein
VKTVEVPAAIPETSQAGLPRAAFVQLSLCLLRLSLLRFFTSKSQKTMLVVNRFLVDRPQFVGFHP